PAPRALPIPPQDWVAHFRDVATLARADGGARRSRRRAVAPPRSVTMPGTARFLSAADRAFLLRLQHAALRYFLDNQTADGLVLDRQRNAGPRRVHGLCSLAATGMGLIALALASAPPHRLLARREAVQRIRTCLLTALRRLPHDQGVVPHFVDAGTLEAR